MKLGRGYDATRTFLRENKKISNEILKAIQKGLKEGGSVAGKSEGSEGVSEE